MNGDIQDFRQQISAITARLDRLEGASQPEPTPGEWRNDRPPAGSYESDDGMVWCWYGGGIRPLPRKMVLSLYATGGHPYWSPGNQPAPTSLPRKLQPEPAPTGWITDRVPEKWDGLVWVPERYGAPDHKNLIAWNLVYPGTPWAPACLLEPGPWDPTTLDRNGWIRSRLPTKKDAERGRGLVSIPASRRCQSWQEYTLVTPGQPWAPCGSNPGAYEP